VDVPVERGQEVGVGEEQVAAAGGGGEEGDAPDESELGVADGFGGRTGGGEAVGEVVVGDLDAEAVNAGVVTFLAFDGQCEQGLGGTDDDPVPVAEVVGDAGAHPDFAVGGLGDDASDLGTLGVGHGVEGEVVGVAHEVVGDEVAEALVGAGAAGGRTSDHGAPGVVVERGGIDGVEEGFDGGSPAGDGGGDLGAAGVVGMQEGVEGFEGQGIGDQGLVVSGGERGAALLAENGGGLLEGGGGVFGQEVEDLVLPGVGVEDGAGDAVAEVGEHCLAGAGVGDAGADVGEVRGGEEDARVHARGRHGREARAVEVAVVVAELGRRRG
jgi:hypothetical protein